MKYLHFPALLALSFGSVLSASAAEVHTDHFVSETLGTEILPSSGTNANLNQTGVNSLLPSVALEAFDYELPKYFSRPP